jgi:hypothetical protein
MKLLKFIFPASLCLSLLVISAAGQAAKKVTHPLDKGDFKAGFSPATRARDKSKSMPADVLATLKEIAAPLNDVIALPYDVYLNFDECDEPNAFYSPDVKEITLCYEFLDEFERVFKKIYKNPKDVENAVEEATVFFFFHELGHCLIDVWDLPATGREEDAVDQLAVIILLDGTREGSNMVLSAARFFSIAGEESGGDELAFWNEHSLDQQRFYDILCLTYGSDTKANARIVTNKLLPKERAERCQDEFTRVDKAWQKLLSPYLK